MVKQLEQRQIPYRVISYRGEDTFCDGWVDFGNHSLKHPTQEEQDAMGRKCIMHVRKGCNLIKNGEIHFCDRSVWRMEQGIIPKNKNEYVDMFDESESVEEKRERLMNLYNSVSITSCAYCNGMCEDSVRYKPAEQLP